METNQTEERKKIALIGIIAALLIIVSVSLYFVYSGNQENVALTTEKNAIDANFKSLTDTLDVRWALIEQTAAANVKLDSTVVQGQKVIDSQKKQISGLLSKGKITRAELEQAKSMMIQYQASISDLEKRVTELCAENLQLTQDNQKLTGDLNNEKNTSSALSEQNRGLSKKVEVGSLLQLAKVDVDGIKERQNGKEVTARNAKAVESLRVSFETGQNKVLATGPLSLYVRVINPKGETISVASQGSGSLQLAESNTQVQYTKRANIDWNQTNKKVLVYCKQNIKDAGTYKVEVYQSGYLIGKGETKLN